MSELEFSVIVPTRARLPQLRRCLAALADQQFPRQRFEVVVVNDGSPALPEAECARFRERLQLLSLEQAWGGPASARNTGTRHARGRFLAFTDDDCAPEPGWLTALARCLSDAPGALVGGQVRNALDDDPFAIASQLLVDYLYAYYASGRARGPGFFASNNLCGPASAVRALGGFDARFGLPAGEDRDFSDRWQAAGGALVHCPEALVMHHHASSLSAFTRQHLNYGRGAWTFHAARAHRSGTRLRVEPSGFYAGLVTHPLRAMSGPRALACAVLLCWAQVANAAGYFLACAGVGGRGPRVGATGSEPRALDSFGAFVEKSETGGGRR